MNKNLIFFILMFSIMQIHPMAKQRTNKSKKTNQKKFTKYTTQFPEYTTWPPDIKEIIINLVTNNTVVKHCKDTARLINSLAQTNKELNTKINDPIFCDKLIKNLTHRFNCSDETILKSLCTEQAKKQFELQCQLKRLCCARNKTPQEQEAELDLLINQEVDLNFMYKHKGSHKTPLMIATKQYDTKNNMFRLLIKKGADINKSTTHGLTVLKVVTEWQIPPSYCYHLLKDPNILINQQDKHGGHALLHALTHKKRLINPDRITLTFVNTIDDLLKAGANPELPNDQALTPLAAAQNLGNEEIIQMILQAIDEKHAALQ